MKITPIILAGGAGERLWPISKADYPKQFVCVDESGLSLFQATLRRVADRARFDLPVIVTQQEQRFIVAEQLRLLDMKSGDIILEPEAKNTAISVLLAALRVATTTPSALMLVLPSDHRIEDEAGFLKAVTQASSAAQAGHIVTFAITPTAPETAYGYIKLGADMPAFTGLRTMDGFIEKPALARAQQFLAEGNYAFNSGMFLLRADVAIEHYQRFAPELYAACRAASAAMAQDMGFLWPAAAPLAACAPLAFDVAIMERTDKGAALPIRIGWSDVGSWRAVDAMATKDASGNAISGNIQTRDTSNCYILSSKPLVAALGVRDLVIVACDDAVLVAHKDKLDEMKPLLAQIHATHAPDTNLRNVVYRPWGRFYAIAAAEGYQVKRLHINPGAKISLQTHAHRCEHWVVVKGTASVQHGARDITLNRNQSIYIRAGEQHRLQNCTKEELVIIEVQSGDYLNEDDIVRYEDAYQRS